MNTTKSAAFQRQIETVLRMSLSDLDLRIKKLFPLLRVKSHLTAAGIRKWEGYAPIHLLFVLVALAFLKITSVHELMKHGVGSFYQARKDTFYRFKNGEWSWWPFYWRFIRHLGGKLNWSRTKNENCFVINTSILAKRGERMEQVSYVYDHTERRTVTGYELVAFGLITPTNFYPLDFCHRFSDKRPEQARDAVPLKPTGSLAKHIREGRALTKIKLAIKMLREALAKGIAASHVLVDAWFTSPKFFQAVREVNLHVVGRLKNGKTRYRCEGKWLTLSQLYHVVNGNLIKDPELGCPVTTLSVTCRNGVEGTIALSRDTKRQRRKPSLEPEKTLSRSGRLSSQPIPPSLPVRSSRSTSCAGPLWYFSGKPNSDSASAKSRAVASPPRFSPQPRHCFRYSILAYLLEKKPGNSTIGDMVHQTVQKAGTLAFCERLWGYFSTVLRRCVETLGQFLNLGPEFREYLDAISTAFKQVTPL